MRRYLGAIVLTAAIAALPQAASAAKFKYGVTAGEVSRNTALVWTRAPKAGKLTVEVSTSRRFRHRTFHRRVKARRSADLTVNVRVRGLRAGRVYYYRFRQARSRSAVGRFRTAPAATSTKVFKFAYSGDADAQRAPGHKKPFWNNFQVYRRMAGEGNAFNINLGDTIYSDTEVGARQPNGAFMPSAPVARSVKQKWAKYRQNLALGNLQLFRRTTGVFNHWDDHEFVNDFTIPENGRALYNRGVTAFRDYMPVTFSRGTGIYRQVHWGANAELFFLDERSFRSAKADDACINPQTGEPDLAPTAPQKNRDFFALLVPSLSQPVSQQCLNAIRDPNRTLLGKSQLTRFQTAVKASKAKWKIIVNEVPIQQFYALPYDRWEGYEADRQEVLKTLSSLKNVVVLTTDTHANMYNDARFQTLENGGPKDSGVPEMVTGPVATRNFDQEIDEATGKPGSGAAVTAAFFKPQPPNGVGMRCAATNVFSYTEVTVSSKKLVLTPKNIKGGPVREAGSNGQPGPRCGPFTLTAR